MTEVKVIMFVRRRRQEALHRNYKTNGKTEIQKYEHTRITEINLIVNYITKKETLN